MGGMIDGYPEEVSDGGVEVHRGREGVDISGRCAGPTDHEGDSPQFAEDGRRRLTEQVVFTEIVAVISAQDTAVESRSPASSMASRSRPSQWSIMVNLEP